MTTQLQIERIKIQFGKMNVKFQIPLQRGNKSFTAYMIPEGIHVDNLGTSPMLIWEVFERAIDLLIENGVGVGVIKGNGRVGTLGDVNTPLDSIEGYVAQHVYNKVAGQSVFRRISAIVGILRWAEIATNGPGVLILKEWK